MVALTGRPDGPPLVPPGRAATVAAKLADRFAAVTGVQVDGAQILAERAAFTGHRRRGAMSAGGACRLLPTADGWAAVSCARPDDPALLGALAATLDPASPDPASDTKHSLAARREGDGWVVEGAGGAVPVAPPRRVSRARR